MVSPSRRPRRRHWNAALAAVMLAAPVRAQQTSDAAIARELDSYIKKGMRDWGIPGLSVAVVHGDSVVLLRGYGVLRLGDERPVDEHTLFGMMSTTKAMTTMAIAMLVDDRRLRWEDPVTRWVPEFAMPDPWVTRELRVQDLLTHSAGLGNADLLWSRQDLSAAEIFERVRLLKPAYPFRSGFVYQNVMYGLAGEVVARASGMSYGDFLRQRLLRPLGMTRTFASHAAMARAGDRNVSRAHYRIRDTVRVIDEEAVDALPAAGAVWSTAADMARWLAFLLDSTEIGGRRLVSDSNFRRLFTPQILIPPEEFYSTARLTLPRWTSYGLGWFQQDYRGRYVAFHTGSLDGRTAIAGLLPEERVGVYLFGNLDHAEFRHAFMFKAFDLFLGAPERDWSTELLRLAEDLRGQRRSAMAASDGQRVPGTRPSHPLAAYAGRYSHPVWGRLVVEATGNGLMLSIGNNPMLRGLLQHWHYDSFRAELGDGRQPPELVQFGLGSDGKVAEVRLEGIEGWFGREQ